MNLLDPTTGEALSDAAIQRILFLANTVHVYQPPPLSSMKGHYASSWTDDPQRHIFTARLRVFETSLPASSTSSSSSSSSSSHPPSSSSSTGAGPAPDIIKIDLVLEDPASGQLFAAAPYTAKADVEPVVDSARFFALTVRDPAGRKAVLGIGFEDRSDAFDLNLALHEANRSLGLDGPGASASHRDGSGSSGTAGPKDYSLKEGETITVNLGRGRRVKKDDAHGGAEQAGAGAGDLQSFALSPPGGGFALKPPPRAADVRMKRQSLQDMGFDDGKFGEFA
ncbi:Adaptin ear-binding coat-associated protein 2 [Escovopsis weberi]|uniref:Adaptin ear-binding coat-associated protein 2 n=1 Tax=Escovopsis weberi TaxID=150374 RepID=A0A0M9VV26_ESCWE|nr:Adaptin ear-binding coat-associated protein 2 [Escovopsis weberi]